MTKANQKIKTMELINSGIHRIQLAYDMPHLDRADLEVDTLIKQSWLLEIISKAERDFLEVKAMDAYYTKKNELEKGKED